MAPKQSKSNKIKPFERKQLDVTPSKECKIEKKAEAAISDAKKAARLQKLKAGKSTAVGESQATRECVLNDSLGADALPQGIGNTFVTTACAIPSYPPAAVAPADSALEAVTTTSLQLDVTPPKKCKVEMKTEEAISDARTAKLQNLRKGYWNWRQRVDELQATRECVLNDSLGIEECPQGNLCAMESAMGIKAFLDGFMPPDAPAGHLVYQRLKVNKESHGRPVVCFSYTRRGRRGRLKICVKNCGGSEEAALRLSRLCFLKLEQGIDTDKVYALRQEWYQKFKSVDFSMTAQISQLSPQREDHASIMELSQLQQLSPRSLNAPSLGVEKDEFLVDFTVSSPAQESQRELISVADKTSASPDLLDDDDDMALAIFLQRRAKIGQISGDLCDDGTEPALGKSLGHYESSDPCSMCSSVSPKARKDCAKSFSQSSSRWGSPHSHRPILSPRQRDADRDESFVDFGVPPAPESHGDLIKAAEETLAMLRKRTAPQMTSRSSRRSKDASQVGAKTMQTSTANARAVRIRKFGARPETAERSDCVKDSSHALKRLNGAEADALGRKRIRAKCLLMEVSPSDKGSSDLEVTASCNTSFDGVSKVASSPIIVELGDVGKAPQGGACSRKDRFHDDRRYALKRQVLGGSKKGGLFARSPFYTRARERLKRKSGATFARCANSLACEGTSIATTKVQASFPRDNATSLQASLEALRKRLQSRSCPRVALESISLAQRFADMVVTWPGYRPSNSENSSDEQDPSTMLVKLAMLAAIPSLLELAVDNPDRETELNAKEALLQQLEGDPSFVANYVKENAQADAAHDLQELETATQQGVHLSEKLLQFKIRAERDVHLAKVRASIACMRGCEALLLATKNAATRRVYAELTWRSCVFTKEAMPSAACAAAMGETQFSAVTSTYASLGLMKSRLAVSRCFEDDSESPNLKEFALQQQCLGFTMELFAESDAITNQEEDGSSFDCASSQQSEYSQALRAMAATGVVQTLAEMALAQWRQAQSNCESRHLLLLAAREDATMKLAANADGECTHVLQDQELRSLLERVSDKRVHNEVSRVLKLDAKMKAEEELRIACERVAAAEDELERCSAATAAWENLAEAAVSRTHSVKVPIFIGEPKASDALSAWKNLSENDWARLDDGRHLNDALVDSFTNFLVNYLGGPRVHAFSSQFFLQLTSRGAEDGAQGWENVRTWTRGVRKLQKHGIFDHDYLILPVNIDSIHWMLVIVCYHAKAGNRTIDGLLGDELAIVPPRMPVILFLDSLGTSVSNQGRLLSFLRGYLSSEWKDCVGGDFDSEAIQGIHVDVPRQNNSYDCGVFVLEFVAQLLRHPDGLKSIAEPIPRHSLLIHAEPRQRWRRAAKILRVEGDAGATRALAEICDDFSISEASSIQDQGNSGTEEVTQLNPICPSVVVPLEVSKSRPQRHHSLQSFSSSRH